MFHKPALPSGVADGRAPKDFGMTVVRRTDTEAWYRGYGPDPYVCASKYLSQFATEQQQGREKAECLTIYAADYARKGPKEFLGGAYLVESPQDLERAIALGDSNAEIRKMSEAPGQGLIVTLVDPEGFPVNLVYMQR